MNDELQELRNSGYKPVLVGPQPFSRDEILRNVAPAPDEETARFVAAIYADRRQAAEDSRPHEPNRRRYRRRLLHLQLALAGAAVRRRAPHVRRRTADGRGRPSLGPGNQSAGRLDRRDGVGVGRSSRDEQSTGFRKRSESAVVVSVTIRLAETVPVPASYFNLSDST